MPGRYLPATSPGLVDVPSLEFGQADRQLLASAANWRSRP